MVLLESTSKTEVLQMPSATHVNPGQVFISKQIRTILFFFGKFESFIKFELLENLNS